MTTVPSTIMEGVREYAEELPVQLITRKGREVIIAHNQGGYDCTLVDLMDLVAWLKANRPELLA